MPIFRLGSKLAFPDPSLAEDGLLAVGGDLSAGRLLLAYASGIFPWYSDGEPILWWSPDPRMILRAAEFHCARRLARTLRQGEFRITFDTAFDEVVRGCATVPRRRERGTWITREMRAAYGALHRAGFAHSVECWRGDALAGGMYGVSLGACFFGESMFSRESGASKCAFATLAAQLARRGDWLIDCQLHTPHLERLGARTVPRAEFLALLRRYLDAAPTLRGPWRFPDADR